MNTYINIYHRKYIFKWWIFHCQVGFPESKLHHIIRHIILKHIIIFIYNAKMTPPTKRTSWNRRLPIECPNQIHIKLVPKLWNHSYWLRILLAQAGTIATRQLPLTCRPEGPPHIFRLQIAVHDTSGGSCISHWKLKAREKTLESSKWDILKQL